MDRGDLVPDEVVISRGLDRRLAGLETPLDAGLNFEVTEEELFRRLAGRSAELHRSDDTEQTIRHRLEVFAEKTRPLIDYYRHRGLLVGVDAVASIERVAARIDAALTALGVAAIVASV